MSKLLYYVFFKQHPKERQENFHNKLAWQRECTHINKKGAVFKITARASGEFDPEQEIQTPYNRRLSTGSYGLVRLYSANNFKSETSQMREIPYQKEF